VQIVSKELNLVQIVLLFTSLFPLTHEFDFCEQVGVESPTLPTFQQRFWVTDSSRARRPHLAVGPETSFGCSVAMKVPLILPHCSDPAR
jgi:hypothetical protein